MLRLFLVISNCPFMFQYLFSSNNSVLHPFCSLVYLNNLVHLPLFTMGEKHMLIIFLMLFKALEGLFQISPLFTIPTLFDGMQETVFTYH